MGQGCPDTAACDTRYYGFFNQVYGAAWQLKRYANPPGTSQFFTWYAPRQDVERALSPERAPAARRRCYIQNQATAEPLLLHALPAERGGAARRLRRRATAARRYGNRNFYNYFTDWFGSTQQIGRVADHGGSGCLLHHRRQPVRRRAQPAGRISGRRSAPCVTVSKEYLSIFAFGGVASAFLRNDSTGEVALLQGAQKHWFGSCALWRPGAARATPRYA